MKLWFPKFEEAGGEGGSGGGGAPPAPATILGGGGGEGGGAPPPAPGAAPAAWAWAAEDGTLSEGWQSKLPDDLKDNPSLKTISNLPLLAKAYVETKSLVGKRLEAPGEGATPEQVAAWRKTVGAPDTPEGYLGEAKSLKPDDLPAEAWDAEGEKEFLSLAHKHHLTPAAVKDILGLHSGSIMKAVQQSKADEGASVAAEIATLKKDWGGDFERNISQASQVAKMAGLDPATNPIFTSAEVVKAFSRMASLLSEDKLVSGGSSVAATTQSRISDITDPKSQSQIAREYRGEFGPQRQQAAQETFHALLKSQEKKP